MAITHKRYGQEKDAQMYDTINLSAEQVRALALDLYDTIINDVRAQEEEHTTDLDTSSDKEVRA